MANKKELTHSLIVADDGDAVRLDQFLTVRFPEYTRSQWQKHVTSGCVKVNDVVVKPGTKLHEGDLLMIQVTAAEPAFEAQPMELDLLYEDADLAVVNKNAGVVVHPGAGTVDTTLAEGFWHHLKTTGELDSVAGEAIDDVDHSSGAATLFDDQLRPGIVHRLDKDTTGVLVLAKHQRALGHLSQQFQEKTNLREYLAILDGVPAAQSQDVETYIVRDPVHRTKFKAVAPEGFVQQKTGNAGVSGAKWAKSLFIVEKTFLDAITLVRVILETGRTHQIRVHAQYLGCPVLGDRVYGRRRIKPRGRLSSGLASQLNQISRQMLHAQVLGFEHPTTGSKLAFRAPIPADFATVLNLLEKGEK